MKSVWVFLRPDGHVYWKTKGSREQAIKELLDWLRLKLVRVKPTAKKSKAARTR